MALTGIEVYKFLPKTNCKECGFPTCLAFAMKLAAKSAELSLCPYVSEESKQALESASRPPIRLVTIGIGDRKIEVGNEVVMFRHEKTFYNPPAFVIQIKDTDSADEIARIVGEVSSYSVERVGLELKLNGLAIENASNNGDNFVKCVELVKSKTDLPLVLMSNNWIRRWKRCPMPSRSFTPQPKKTATRWWSWLRNTSVPWHYMNPPG